jgi:mono/diheme cytochrome c family protein
MRKTGSQRKSPPRALLASLLAASALLHPSSPAMAAAGRPDAGRLLITTSCTSCHTAPAAQSGTDVAPPFAAIARNNRGNSTWIRLWLTDPHPPMRGINLTRQQIEDVIAYLESLPME